mgnify:CR=1 FL=1
MDNSAKTITRGELLSRAQNMLPLLEENAEKAEANRRIPKATDKAFREAGFYKIMQPTKFGGYELEFGTQTELAIILAPGCASSAWMASVTACHGWLLGMFPPKAQKDVWNNNPDASIASSFLPFAPKIKRVEGGLRVSGRWGFSSGVDYCSWAILTMKVPSKDKPKKNQSVFALVPLENCQILDTWYATGLAATGSNDILIENVFIPDYRTVDMLSLRGGLSPGSEINPGYLYRLPQRATFSYNLVGTAIGAARGALEAIISELKSRVTVSGNSLSDLTSVHFRIAEAEAEISAAYALMTRNRDEIICNGKADIVLPAEQRARYRRDNAFVTKLCVQAVDRLYPITGGRGLSITNKVNRAWRDVHAVSHHIALTWDVSASVSGAIATGAPLSDPLL